MHKSIPRGSSIESGYIASVGEVATIREFRIYDSPRSYFLEGLELVRIRYLINLDYNIKGPSGSG